MSAYVKITKAATIGGTTYRPGELVEVDRETGLALFRLLAAVPHPGPGKRSLTSEPMLADVHPTVGRK
jgi:hypothetical protein